MQEKTILAAAAFATQASKTFTKMEKFSNQKVLPSSAQVEDLASSVCDIIYKAIRFIKAAWNEE